MDLEKTVREACALREPPPEFEDAVMRRVSAAAWRASQARPRKRHVFVIGMLLVSAAAAAMLGSAIHRVMAPRVIAESGATSAAIKGGVSSVPAAAAAAINPAPVNFTVHLRSLQHDSTDAVVMSRVREYYTAIADGLRVVPGLHLLDDIAAEAAGTPASFRITIDNPDAYIAGQMLAKGEWAATFKVEVLKAGVYVPAQVHTRGGAYSPDSMAAQATGGPLSGKGCPVLILCTPTAIAAWQVKDLRLQLFPLDVSLQQELEARFLDPAQSQVDRMYALNDLHDLSLKTGIAMSTEVVHAVLQQIAGSSYQNDRGTLWYHLSGQRHPEMIQPLINMAQQDPDAWERLGAVSQLAGDFQKDSAARIALQSIARRDPELLNRKVAERALSGNAPWNAYVLATVKDATQSMQQRLAPLRWMVAEQSRVREVGSGTDPMASLSRTIFGKDRQAFIDLLVQAGRETNGSISNWALRTIGSMQRPESTEFLLAVLKDAPDSGHLLLLKEHLDDPAVRERVEELAADPAITPVQATAAGMLGRQSGN